MVDDGTLLSSSFAQLKNKTFDELQTMQKHKIFILPMCPKSTLALCQFAFWRQPKLHNYT